jgi:hypothetical protein
MIRNVAGLLEAFRQKSASAMPSYDEVGHTGMFGDMYEGLTRELLERGLFDGCDLRVVSGKVVNSKGILSRQVDCMIVVGEGQQLPFTTHYVYPLSQVVAICEVKKTLYSSALSDSIDWFTHFRQNVAEGGKRRVGLLDDAWRGIFGESLPSEEEMKLLPVSRRVILEHLIVEAVSPARIVVGFEGFCDEASLRKGVLDLLDAAFDNPEPNQRRFSISAFPNLVVCGQASIIKLDGFPFSAKANPNDWYAWFASSSYNPLVYLLEILWTRLAYLLKLPPEVFGDDLRVEQPNPLLWCRAVASPYGDGWEYFPVLMEKEYLKASSGLGSWEPEFLSEVEFDVMNLLCAGLQVRADCVEIAKLFRQRNSSFGEVAKSLKARRLAHAKDGRLELLTDKCVCFILPDGRFAAAENKSGRATQYVDEYLNRRQTM